MHDRNNIKDSSELHQNTSLKKRLLGHDNTEKDISIDTKQELVFPEDESSNCKSKDEVTSEKFCFAGVEIEPNIKTEVKAKTKGNCEIIITSDDVKNNEAYFFHSARKKTKTITKTEILEKEDIGKGENASFHHYDIKQRTGDIENHIAKYADNIFEQINTVTNNKKERTESPQCIIYDNTSTSESFKRKEKVVTEKSMMKETDKKEYKNVQTEIEGPHKNISTSEKLFKNTLVNENDKEINIDTKRNSHNISSDLDGNHFTTKEENIEVKKMGSDNTNHDLLTEEKNKQSGKYLQNEEESISIINVYSDNLNDKIQCEIEKKEEPIHRSKEKQIQREGNIYQHERNNKESIETCRDHTTVNMIKDETKLRIEKNEKEPTNVQIIFNEYIDSLKNELKLLEKLTHEFIKHIAEKSCLSFTESDKDWSDESKEKFTRIKMSLHLVLSGMFKICTEFEKLPLSKEKQNSIDHAEKYFHTFITNARRDYVQHICRQDENIDLGKNETSHNEISKEGTGAIHKEHTIGNLSTLVKIPDTEKILTTIENKNEKQIEENDIIHNCEIISVQSQFSQNESKQKEYENTNYQNAFTKQEYTTQIPMIQMHPTYKEIYNHDNKASINFLHSEDYLPKHNNEVNPFLKQVNNVKLVDKAFKNVVEEIKWDNEQTEHVHNNTTQTIMNHSIKNSEQTTFTKNEQMYERTNMHLDFSLNYNLQNNTSNEDKNAYPLEQYNSSDSIMYNMFQVNQNEDSPTLMSIYSNSAHDVPNANFTNYTNTMIQNKTNYMSYLKNENDTIGTTNMIYDNMLNIQCNQSMLHVNNVDIIPNGSFFEPNLWNNNMYYMNNKEELLGNYNTQSTHRIQNIGCPSFSESKTQPNCCEIENSENEIKIQYNQNINMYTMGYHISDYVNQQKKKGNYREMIPEDKDDLRTFNYGRTGNEQEYIQTTSQNTKETSVVNHVNKAISISEKNELNDKDTVICSSYGSVSNIVRSMNTEEIILPITTIEAMQTTYEENVMKYDHIVNEVTDRHETCSMKQEKKKCDTLKTNIRRNRGKKKTGISSNKKNEELYGMVRAEILRKRKKRDRYYDVLNTSYTGFNKCIYKIPCMIKAMEEMAQTRNCPAEIETEFRESLECPCYRCLKKKTPNRDNEKELEKLFCSCDICKIEGVRQEEKEESESEISKKIKIENTEGKEENVHDSDIKDNKNISKKVKNNSRKGNFSYIMRRKEKARRKFKDLKSEILNIEDSQVQVLIDQVVFNYHLLPNVFHGKKGSVILDQMHPIHNVWKDTSRGLCSWRCRWIVDGKVISRNFNVHRFGDTVALRMAVTLKMKNSQKKKQVHLLHMQRRFLRAWFGYEWFLMYVDFLMALKREMIKWNETCGMKSETIEYIVKEMGLLKNELCFQKILRNDKEIMGKEETEDDDDDDFSADTSEDEEYFDQLYERVYTKEEEEEEEDDEEEEEEEQEQDYDQTEKEEEEEEEEEEETKGEFEKSEEDEVQMK